MSTDPNMPLVSVIVPIYGVEAYIGQCARSVLGQTYSRLECIFVNDGTPDRSMEILSEVVKEYPGRNIVIVNKENDGLPHARWSGLEVSTGEYIMHVDADDWLEPDAAERLVDEALRTQADLVYCDFWKEYGHRHLRQRTAAAEGAGGQAQHTLRDDDAAERAAAQKNTGRKGGQTFRKIDRGERGALVEHVRLERAERGGEHYLLQPGAAHESAVAERGEALVENHLPQTGARMEGIGRHTLHRRGKGHTAQTVARAEGLGRNGQERREVPQLVEGLYAAALENRAQVGHRGGLGVAQPAVAVAVPRAHAERLDKGVGKIDVARLGAHCSREKRQQGAQKGIYSECFHPIKTK